MLLAILIVVISFLLYMFAPNMYDYSFILTLFLIFIFSTTITIKKSLSYKKNYFNFPILFSISFLFVNFIYPVILYPINPGYFSVFKSFSFDSNLISKSTALALLGYAAFSLGIFFYYNKNKINTLSNNFNSFTYAKDLPYNKEIINVLTYIFVFLTTILIYLSKESILTRDKTAFFEIPPPLIVLTQVILTISIILVFWENNKYQNQQLKYILKNNKILLLFTTIYILAFLYVGDRGPALQAILVIMFCYSYILKPIKLKSFIAIILIGMFSMTIISYARLSSTSFIDTAKEFKINSIADIGMDLIVNNRNLYVGYEIANYNGFSYGKSMFYYVFSPFPLIPTITTKSLFGVLPGELSTSSIITNYSNASYGLGTNVIIDLYMQFGVAGVIIFMFLLGWLVTRASIYANFIRINNMFVIAFFMSFAIYMPRSSMFDSIRFISWAIFIYWSLRYFLHALHKLSKRRA